MAGLKLSATLSGSKKTFPDITKSGGGQFSGLLTGLQAAQGQMAINRQQQMNQQLMGFKERETAMREMKAAAPTISTKGKLGIKDLIGLYNKENAGLKKQKDKIDTINSFYASTGRAPLPIPEIPSFSDWLQNSEYAQYSDVPSLKLYSPQTQQQEAPVGGGLSPAEWSARRAWASNIPMENRGPAITTPLQYPRRYANGGIVDNPQMAMVGEGGEREYIVPQSKVDPQMQAQLEQILGPAGQGQQPPQGQPGGQNLNITTDQLLQALQEYDNADEAIADIIELDRQVNQPGLNLGGDIDYELLKREFIRKFGEGAFRKLEASVQ